MEATVEHDFAGRGTVTLLPEEASSSALQFVLGADAHKLLSDSNQDWREIVIRLAVFQAHKALIKKALPADPIALLNLDSQLWLGDLLLAPYGGATYGVQRQKNHEG